MSSCLLAGILFYKARFNPETGMLEDTRAPVPPAGYTIGEPWTNPDENIARAQAALREATCDQSGERNSNPMF